MSRRPAFDIFIFYLAPWFEKEKKFPSSIKIYHSRREAATPNPVNAQRVGKLHWGLFSGRKRFLIGIVRKHEKLTY